MGNIVKFDECKEEERKRRKREKFKKLTAIGKIFECTRCSLKCTRCGTQVAVSPSSSCSGQMPCRFCTRCENEFRDFLNRKRGKSQKDLYWQSQEWMAIWEIWIQYQKAMRKYENSDEFKKLLNEVSRGLE